jgi:hypothetical protein
MNLAWKHWITVACIVAATSVAIAQNKDSRVITGNHWMKASSTERRVFLIGGEYASGENHLLNDS